MKYKLTLWMIMLCMSSMTWASTPPGEFIKTIQNEFDISDNGLVHITNKYGKVDIHSWDQSKVQIKVLIKVDAGSENKANEVFDKIHIEFENAEDYVKAWTNLEEMSESKWFWGKSKKYKFTVDYEVNAPASNELFVHNKYGNTYIGDFNNDVETEIKYGDLTMGKIDGDVKTTIKYGNAQFQDIGNLELDCGYSNLKGMEAGDMVVTSKYSKIAFDKVGDVDLSTKYDEFALAEAGDIKNAGKYDSFKLGKVRSLDLISKYTHVSVDELLRHAHIQLEYGGVKVKDVSPACTKLDLHGKYTGVKLYLDGDYQLELETKYTDVNLPDEFNFETKDKDGSQLHIMGYSGSKTADTKILVNLKYGNFTVK